MQKREFLKSGLAALGGLGWMATGAIAKEIPESKDIQRDETRDVIIVGTGIAGTCAGNEALDQGAKKVLMLDKMPVFCGNSAITGF